MSRLIRTARRTLLSSPYFASKSLFHGLQSYNQINFFAISSFIVQSRPFATAKTSTAKTSKSPFEANILRILYNEIEYQSDCAPPHQPATKFNSFVVQDRPGEQWMTMRRTFNDSENIKLEVTMFDGYETFSNSREEVSSAEDVRFHISLLVDIFKKDGGDALEFVCSAWPDCLEIQKVYSLKRDNMLARPYMGPDFRSLNRELQQRLREFLEERGVNDKLSVFLHEYMMNKDRIELIQWFGKVKSFVEK